MDDLAHMAWLPAALTLVLLAGYEVRLARDERRRPGRRQARAAHAALREEWFAAVSAAPGSEILAVQTIRNSLMSATMTASTAVLGLMGTLTLTAPSLRASLGVPMPGGWPAWTARLSMELVVLALLMAALVASVMAVRYYTHAGFVGGMPVASDARRRWDAAGAAYIRRAGVLYSWSLRQLVLVVPAVAFMLHPLAGPLAALGVITALLNFDRFRAMPGANAPSASA